MKKAVCFLGCFSLGSAGLSVIPWVCVYMFNIYMKPLSEIVWSFGIGYHQYANGTQLCISWNNPLETDISISKFTVQIKATS